MIETQTLVAADGERCAVRSSGNDGPSVLFVHGVGSTAKVWDPQLESLSSGFRTHAVELRGNGAAPQPAQPYAAIDREGFVLDVIAVADAFRAPRFHFVGCSLGGVVGFELWRRFPDRILSLTLIGSFAAYPNAQTMVETIHAAVSNASSMREFAQSRAARLLPPNAPPQRLHDVVEQMAVKDRECYLAATQATWTGDYRDVLPTVSVPTLVLCGQYDLVAPPALSEEIARGIPNARFETIAGAGHIANADAPEDVSTRIREFLSTPEPKGP